MPLGRRSPIQPDYEAQEILDDLRERHALTDGIEWYEEFGLREDEIRGWIQEYLERDSEDVRRLKEEMRRDAALSHKYDEDSWVEEEEEKFKKGTDTKTRYNRMIRDKDNNDAYILFSEVEYD